MTDSGQQGAPEGGTGLPVSALGFEEHGIERIPEDERTQSPWAFFFMSLGSAWSLGFVAYGWLPIVLGLSLWDAVTSMILGVTLGMLIIAPLILIGIRTATNNTTTSIAFFGVRGQVLGTIVVLAAAILYTLIAVWVGADAIFASIGRLTGTGTSTTGLYIAYGVLSLIVAFIALYGYHLMLRFEIVLAILGACLVLLSLVALGPHMDLSWAGGEYVLGGRWQTYLLAVVAVGIAGPMSFVGQTGDWTRYISDKRYSRWQVLGPSVGGLWLGLVAPTLVGTFTTVAFKDPFADYAFGLVDASPGWYVVIVLIVAVVCTLGSAVTTAYNAGLAMQTLTPGLKRFSTTLITASLTAALIYLGAIYAGLGDTMLSATLITVVVTTPWGIVIILGNWLNKGRFNYEDLTRFARGETGGIYWSTGGWNLRGVVALVAGSFFGIMAVQAPPIMTGPWADIAGGVDVSFLGAAAISTVVYLLLRLVFPEPPIVEVAAQESSRVMASAIAE
jgi:purine-cytosine permease-like protein